MKMEPGESGNISAKEQLGSFLNHLVKLLRHFPTETEVSEIQAFLFNDFMYLQ